MPGSPVLIRNTLTQYHIDIYGKHIAALAHDHSVYRAGVIFAHYPGDARHIQSRANVYMEKAPSLLDLTYRSGTLDHLPDQSQQA